MIYNVSGSAITEIYKKDGSQANIYFDVNGTAFETRDGELPTHEMRTEALTENLAGSVTANGIKQGGCTDGTYIYQCSGDITNFTYMNVIKYDIANATYTVQNYTRTDANFGHANGMAYNPNTGYLYVATMLTDGSVIVIDPSDMSIVGTVYVKDTDGTTPVTVWQLCYDRLGHRFITSIGNYFYFYDDNFQYLYRYPIETTPSATYQDCDTDGGYIYRITYNPNNIYVNRITGEYVGDMTSNIGGEPETIMYDWNSHFYASKQDNGRIFYKLFLWNE